MTDLIVVIHLINFNNLHKKKLAFEVERNIFKLNDKKLILKWKSIVSPHLDSKNNQDKNSII